MDENNRNFILAIVLSIGVLFAWQYFFVPKRISRRAADGATAADGSRPSSGPPQPPGGGEAPVAGGAPQPGRIGRSAAMTREEALAQSPRVAIDTPSLKGSINLKGGRIDDLLLADYRETVEPTSPLVVLLSPAGGPHAYYAEYGWVGGAPARTRRCPDADTVWTAERRDR